MNKININNTNRDSKSCLLNLCSTTSWQALEAKAVRASMRAHVERSLQTTENSAAQRSKRKSRALALTGIERELNIIRSAFQHAKFDHTEVRVSKPAAGSSAVCVITTWHKDSSPKESGNTKHVWRQEVEDTTMKVYTEKGKEAERTYVFYPSSADGERLGSVAIYGSNVVLDYESIRCKGRLFGIEVRSVSVKLGRRPFIDVTFRA